MNKHDSDSGDITSVSILSLTESMTCVKNFVTFTLFVHYSATLVII